MKKQNKNLTDAAQLRQKAEELLQRRDVACNVSTNSTSEHDMLKLIHELEVHQIELEMQNEELVIAKEKAEQAEEKYTEMYDFAPSGYITLSKNGEIKELNFAAAQMLGKERSKLIENRFVFFVSIDTQTTFNLFLNNVLTGKLKQTCEVIIATDGNLPIFVNIDGVVSQNDEFCLLTITDITERKSAEKNLLEEKKHVEVSEARFRKLMENIDTVAVQGYGPDGITQFWNKASEKLYGYTQQEAIGSNLLDLIIPSEMKEGVTNAMHEMAQSGEPIPSGELLLKHKDGSPVPVISHHAIVKVPGHLQELFCFDIDISEQKQAEAELKNSREASANLNTLLNAILESPQDMVVFALDNKYCYTAFTKAHKLVMKSLWGVDIKVGDNMLDYISRSQDRNKAQNSFGRCLQGEFFILEEEYGDSSLQRKYYETRYSPLFNKLKEIIGLTVFNIDITERKLMEDTQAFLLQISNPGSDENFFQLLAKYLSKCLDMEYVCIDVLEGDRLTAKTLAIYNEGNFDPNVSYALKDTPCGEVVGNHICCYPQEVRSLFPNDAALNDIKAESYIGTTLWSFDGQPIGLIAVIGQKPLQNQELAASLLKLVSLRAAGKLEATLADEKLRESEEKFRVLIESTSVGIYLTDLNGKCTYVNPKWCELAQISYNEALGDGWANGIYEEDREKFFENWQKMIASDGNWGLEYRFGTPNKISWVYGTVKSYKNDSGQIVGYIGSNVDITGRKQSEATIRDIIEKNPMSIQILDMEGYPIQVNSAHTQLFGVEIPSDYSIFKDSQLLDHGFVEFFERIKKGEVVYFPDSYYNVHDVDQSFPDSPVWVKALGFTLNDINGNPNKIVLMHENITERKFIEHELIKAKEHAEESDRLKSAFLANMSHEIRTPMNGILGFADLLKEPGLTGDEQQNYIEIIEKSGKRMLNIINDIIDISKIEAGLMKLDISESNINEQIEYIYTFFKPEVEAKGMKLTCRNSLTAKEAIIKTDREKLYAILINLVKNAIKYTKEGTIEFGYDLVVETQCIASLQFYIKDTGIGIPKNRQEAIFERFIQADIADKMARQGAGLGLTITKSYIEMLGGKIWLESEEGIGSTFYFTLPYNAQPAKEITDQQPESLGNDYDFGKLKILIAEDDIISEMLIDSYIKMFGKEVLKAKTGVEAVEVCRNNPDIDLILMDIRMPDMDGYEATRQIRQFNQEVVIIAQTAYGLFGDKEKAIEVGCNDYIAKPINKTELQLMIQKYFGKNKV